MTTNNLAPHGAGYDITGTSTSWITYISAIFWVPYTVFLLYLFYEHKSRRQFPQYNILLFLACGSLCRCIWLFVVPYYTYSVSSSLLNRFAILFQFSAISLLMLMWDRALTVTNNVDRSVAQMSAREKAPTAHVLGRALAGNNQNARFGGSNSVGVASVASMHQAKHDTSLHTKTWAWLAVNLIAYSFVVITTVADYHSELLYTINLVSIAVLCLLVNVGIMKVGLTNWARLRKDLVPVYPQNHNNQSSATTYRTQGTMLQSCWHSLLSCGGLSMLFCRSGGDHSSNWSFSGAQQTLGFSLQARVIRVMLAVSFTIAFFFFIRAFCFMYFSLYVDNGGSDGGLGNLLYPLFFYQLPELFPNVAIAYAISPPNSICRILLFCFEAKSKWERLSSKSTVSSSKLGGGGVWALLLWPCSLCCSAESLGNGRKHGNAQDSSQTGEGGRHRTEFPSFVDMDHHGPRNTQPGPQSSVHGSSMVHPRNENSSRRGLSARGTLADRLSSFFAWGKSMPERAWASEASGAQGNHIEQSCANSNNTSRRNSDADSGFGYTGDSTSDAGGDVEHAAGQASSRAYFGSNGNSLRMDSTSESAVELSAAAALGGSSSGSTTDNMQQHPHYVDSIDQGTTADNLGMERQRALLDAMEEFLYNASAIPTEAMGRGGMSTWNFARNIIGRGRAESGAPSGGHSGTKDSSAGAGTDAAGAGAGGRSAQSGTVSNVMHQQQQHQQPGDDDDVQHDSVSQKRMVVMSDSDGMF